jgi:RNA polymerase sigma-70 factor (ECF subfamily)
MDKAEQDVIKRILAGDTDRYRILMDRHLPTVLRMTLRITGSVEDAEEAAQEAFLRAYNNLASFRKDANFGTWVYRIAANCALNLIERRHRDPSWNAVPIDGTPQAESVLLSERPDPEAEVLHAEALLRRDALLNCLTPMERSAFVLRHFEEQSIVVVAAALDVTANTARQTIFRAVSKLRRQFAPVTPVSSTTFSPSRFARES